ncbi:hypothetical protein QTO34_016905 [Cnephaeus nilssonii]|uniref:Uncharacterized protein n=1 Tax=Cnephaeus nilssonii TaxID=3371016 RepID=A0AA40LSB4_CNENI|nr:hypothetical protein QTO34_016905 [Eptesicus nilssonii]
MREFMHRAFTKLFALFGPRICAKCISLLLIPLSRGPGRQARSAEREADHRASGTRAQPLIASPQWRGSGFWSAEGSQRRCRTWPWLLQGRPRPPGAGSRGARTNLRPAPPRRSHNGARSRRAAQAAAGPQPGPWENGEAGPG